MAKSSIVSTPLLLLMFINIGPHSKVAAQRSHNASRATFIREIVDREEIGNPEASVLIPQPNIGVNGYFSNDKAQRGRTIQAAIVIDIPSGYHVNANRPLNKYSIPTSLKVEGPRGITIGPTVYPRAVVRKLKAVNNEPLAVYESRAILRFNVTVSANYQEGSADLKARLKFQSCNDEVCFPPKTRVVNMGIGVVSANDRVQRTNGWVFGRR